MLFCCYLVPLLFTCSTISLYSDCSASILLFCQCPGVPPVFRCCARLPCSMFRCSWFYSMSFKMNLIMYSTKKQLLINIQKSHAPNPITPCYCTSNWHYTRYIQPKLYFLSDKDCIDCFLPDIWLEGMWMIFIFYFLDFQVVFFYKYLDSFNQRSTNNWRCDFC